MRKHMGGGGKSRHIKGDGEAKTKPAKGQGTAGRMLQ